MAESSVGWKEVAIAGISILASVSSAALWAVFNINNQRLQEGIEERCRAMSERVSAIEQHDRRVESKVDGALITIGTSVAKMDAHFVEAEAWKAEIRANRGEIVDLRTRAGARPDPYTGTDARRRAEAVDAELRNLDRRLDALEVEVVGRANGNGVKKK